MTVRISPARLVIFAAIAGGLILSVNMGVRQSLGMYLEPMTQANGWARSEFAMGIALQNLIWGVFTPFAGALADRYGAMRVMLVGAVLYSLGLVVMAISTTSGGFITGAGVLIGLGTGATGFPLVLAVVGRIVEEKRRSMMLGMVAAGGSFGQFVLPLVIVWVMEVADWTWSLYVIAAIALVMLPAVILLVRPDVNAPHKNVG